MEAGFNTRNDFSGQESPQNAPVTVEYKRLLFRALRYWYLVVLSLLTGLTIAFLYNRYAVRIYPVNASIIIRESEERTDARLLYKDNPLANPYRNFYNEPYILKSYPLIQGVIEDLNFQVVVQKEGNIKTTEQYTSLPLTIKVINPDETTPASFVFETIDDRTFQCLGLEETGGNKNNIFNFGDTINCHNNTLLVQKTGDVSRIKGERYQVNIYDPQRIASSYISRLKINWALQGASVVDLDINGPIPAKEIDFLNQLIANYQQYDLDKKNQAAIRSIGFIDEQLGFIGDSLAFFERQLQRFKKQNVVTDLSGETLRLYQELELLEKQKVDLMVSENYYQYLEKYLREGRNLEQVILPSSMGISDPILNDLILKFINVQTELKIQKPLPEGMKNPLFESNQRIITQTRSSIQESLVNLRSTDKIKKTFLEQQIRRIESSLGGLPEAERMLVNIRRNYSLNESIYIFLMQKRAEAGISQAAKTSDIIIVNPPRLAGSAITPKVVQNYMIFGSMGLLIPFIIFYLFELFNNKVQSKEDIEKLTSVPFIGALGHKTIDGNLVIVEKPKSSLAESFRALRSNLNYFTEGKDHKVFIITSSLSGEGKTFTTINLAMVFALSGKRTVIIGADMRRPKIFNDFGLNNDVGLSNYLSGITPMDSIIQATGQDNLDLISSGPVPPNPSELILNHRMDLLMEKLKTMYDFVLIDTPPIALITDGFVLTKFADHTIFLVRQNYTPKSMLNSIEDFYRTGKLRNISLLLNDIKTNGIGYGYGYGYGYCYGYGYGSYGSKKDQGYYSED